MSAFVYFSDLKFPHWIGHLAQITGPWAGPLVLHYTSQDRQIGGTWAISPALMADITN